MKEKIDPELFEQCATDLLRAYHPTISPIRGACDGGKDGAISDGKGLPYPLISTTQKDVIGNLTKSLKSYLSEGGPRRRVIVATSQELSGKRRHNLENRAAELGFTLIQIHTQATFADLLYRNPTWCMELLNLTGEPPPLSVLPITRRLLTGEYLIGREDDFNWLKNFSGDLLLVGQPGSGKTFLFHKLAKEGHGLFVVSQDRSRIAAGIRSQQPNALIIDDAHLYLDVIDSVRHLRTELGANFRIVANCWPGQLDEVAQALNITGSSTRVLNPLTRDQIVEIVKCCGIGGPNHLIRELVNQAHGKPGLATTLCYICLNGTVREVALGDALSRDIRNTFEPLLGREATTILACFAIGGDQGMPMAAVAQNLDLSLLHVREAVTRLAAGGVLSEVGRDNLSVRPPALRYALVRDTFFKGATSLPCDALIRQASNISDVTLTLIGSQARGAVIRQDMLQDLLRQSLKTDVWVAYCSLGVTECSWVLNNYPEKLTIVAFAALRVAPKKVIAMLLTEAIGDERELAPNPEHPLRLIKDWVKAGKPGTGEAIKRREMLLESIESWYLANEDLEIAMQALQQTISLEFLDTETDPGSGRTFTIRHGSITYDELIAIQGFWPRIFYLFRDKYIENWQPIQKIVEAWAYPSRLRVNITEEFSETMRSGASVMLKDILTVSQNRPALLHWAKHIAEDLDTKMQIDLDPEFEILFPKERFRDYEKWVRERAIAASNLAKSWSRGTR